MKFLTLSFLITTILIAQQTEAFLFRPWGLGLGFRRWGFGLGGWGGFGLGGWGVGFGGVPLAVPVPVPVLSPVAGVLPAAGFGGLALGKREASGYGYNVHKPEDSSKMVESDNKVDSDQKVEGHDSGIKVEGQESEVSHMNVNNHPNGLHDSGIKVEGQESEVSHMNVNHHPNGLHDDKGNMVEGMEQSVETTQPPVVPPFRFVQPLEVAESKENNTLDEFFFGNETEVFNSSLGRLLKRAIVVPAVAVPVPVVRPIVTPLVVPVVRPIIRLAPVVRAFPVAAPVVIGKRSLLNESDIAENRTVCRLSTVKSVISCEGVNFNFECGLVANLTVLGDFEQKGENFRMLPDSESFNRTELPEVDVNRFEIASFRDESSDLNDYTFVHGGQKVVLSLYWSESVQDMGFRFREQQCWKSYVDMLRGLGPRNVRLVLDVARA